MLVEFGMFVVVVGVFLLFSGCEMCVLVVRFVVVVDGASVVCLLVIFVLRSSVNIKLLWWRCLALVIFLFLVSFSFVVVWL